MWNKRCWKLTSQSEIGRPYCEGKEVYQHFISKRNKIDLCSLHQCMREADFGTIDGAIAGGFDDGKERGKIRVQYYAVHKVLAGS